ncbi:hypothetical protein [Halopelagius longus]|uniref:hypothetical protein n=1 Tax=Halopelagius longus TaxID=1236180 RepID=UPI001113B5DC|nr:hypothetical protein [Halopelagius longus]
MSDNSTTDNKSNSNEPQALKAPASTTRSLSTRHPYTIDVLAIILVLAGVTLALAYAGRSGPRPSARPPTRSEEMGATSELPR